MGIFKNLKTRIHGKLIDHYIKKGVRIALKEIISENQFTEKDKAKHISDIGILNSILREEIDISSSILIDIENKYGQNKEAAEIATIFPFLYLSIIDILILMKQYLNTNDTYEKKFICKSAGHHMYEFIEDAGKVFGKQVKFIVENLNDPDLKKELHNLRKFFNDLRNDLYPVLKIIRHNISGHKDRDIRKQLEISNSISLHEFEDRFGKFVSLFGLIFHFNKAVEQAILKTKSSN